MDQDDMPVGRVLTRRDAVRLLTLGSAAVLTGCSRGAGGAADTALPAAGTGTTAAARTAATAVPGCVVRPELTVGPYFVDRQLERIDIRTEPATGKVTDGVPLDLAFNVSQVQGGACAPLAGAMVDVWHCDAQGTYSGVDDRTVGFDTQGQKYLRGYQVTGADGVARFRTIYPGWYPGRTVHIHFKVRTPAAAALADDAARTYEFTSQLFFDEALTDRVFARAPYAAKGRRDTTNANDGIYRDAGEQLLLAVAPDGEGYRAAFDIALDLSDTGTGGADRSGGPGGRPPGGRPGARRPA
jgi:protocatechuate 3,4-dioxygenase beta subunit